MLPLQGGQILRINIRTAAIVLPNETAFDRDSTNPGRQRFNINAVVILLDGFDDSVNAKVVPVKVRFDPSRPRRVTIDLIAQVIHQRIADQRTIELARPVEDPIGFARHPEHAELAILIVLVAKFNAVLFLRKACRTRASNVYSSSCRERELVG